MLLSSDPIGMTLRRSRGFGLAAVRRLLGFPPVTEGGYFPGFYDLLGHFSEISKLRTFKSRQRPPSEDSLTRDSRFIARQRLMSRA